MNKKWILALLAMGVAGSVLAHPHFNKTVTAKLSDTVEVTLRYNSTDANMDHVNSAADGAFLTPRRPSVNFSGDAMSGSTKIPAGDYTVGVIKSVNFKEQTGLEFTEQNGLEWNGLDWTGLSGLNIKEWTRLKYTAWTELL